MLVLRPGNKQGRPRDEFVVPGVLSFRFDLFCAWHLNAEALLGQSAENTAFLPLLPFAEGASVERVEQALRILARDVPRPRTVALQATLATFAGSVFPHVSWLDTIPEEIRMESSFLKELRSRSRAEVVAKQLSHRLGKSRKLDLLLKRLPECSDAVLDKISILILDEEKASLLASVERLIPKK